MLEITGSFSSVLEHVTKLVLSAKTGIDCSGSHAARQQVVDQIRSRAKILHLDSDIVKNYLSTCFCPLTLSKVLKNGLGMVLRENKQPNSLQLTRPISLIRTQEEREVIAETFSPLFNEI